jgi:hypothetical protein
MFDELAKIPSAGAFSRAGWGALGVCETLFAVLLVVPAAMKWMPVLTPLAAGALAQESLGLAVPVRAVFTGTERDQSAGLGRRDRACGGARGLWAVRAGPWPDACRARVARKVQFYRSSN